MSGPPRYRPERALPSRAFLPGRGGRPSAGSSADHDAAGAPRVPAANWRDDTLYLWGVDLYNNGFFWEAHEAWEGPWRAAERDGRQRLFLQGLIQCAAACVKVAVGEELAVRRLTERAMRRLERVQVDCDGPYMGLDVARFIAEFRRFAEAEPRTAALPPSIWLASVEPDAPASRDPTQS